MPFISILQNINYQNYTIWYLGKTTQKMRAARSQLHLLCIFRRWSVSFTKIIWRSLQPHLCLSILLHPWLSQWQSPLPSKNAADRPNQLSKLEKSDSRFFNFKIIEAFHFLHSLHLQEKLMLHSSIQQFWVLPDIKQSF